MRPRNVLLLAVSLLALWANSARGVTLDWNVNNTFTEGQTNNYDVDPASAGNDISVVINTSSLGAGTMTAGVDATNEGGNGANTNSLGILLNFSTVGEFVTVTVTFSAAYTQGVQNVSFTLFDVDYVDAGKGFTQFRDQISSITATTINNTTVGATITDGVANNITSGSGPTQVVEGIANSLSTGTSSSDGNVTIDFGGNAIKSFTFVYGSGAISGNKPDPTDQKIGIYNITFAPVPEINPAWSALVSCIAAAGLILRHRANLRK